MPVDSEEAEEYRVHREREALLKGIGINSDKEMLRAVASSSGASDNGDLSSILEGNPEWVPGDFHVNMLRLLKAQVLQNELIIRALRRVEKALKNQAKPVNAIEWK